MNPNDRLLVKVMIVVVVAAAARFTPTFSATSRW